MTLPALPPLPVQEFKAPAPQQAPYIPPASTSPNPRPAPAPGQPPVVSTSATDLTNVQNNSNKSEANAVVENTVVNQQAFFAPNTQVGDIAYQGPHAFVSGYFNGNDQYGVQAGIQVPLGGGKVRKAAGELAKLRVGNYRLSTCAAISNSNLTAEQVASQDASYVSCVRQKVATATTEADYELAVLRAELRAIRAELEAARRQRPTVNVNQTQHQQTHNEHSKPVRGLW